MPVLSGRALALVILAWSLVKVLLQQLFTRPRPGLEQFNENYGEEGLCALDAEEREQLVRFSGCIACGRCDVGEADRIAAARGAYPGIMQLVLASSRSMPDYGAAARGFAHVPTSALARKVRDCPARIPFVELARFVTRKAAH
jgi:hypothetical protein